MTEGNLCKCNLDHGHYTISVICSGGVCGRCQGSLKVFGPMKNILCTWQWDSSALFVSNTYHISRNFKHHPAWSCNSLMHWAMTTECIPLPHSVILGREKSDQFGSHVELVLVQETHQYQQTSSEQYSKQEPIKQEGLKEASQRTKVHQKCILALQEQ